MVRARMEALSIKAGAVQLAKQIRMGQESGRKGLARCSEVESLPLAKANHFVNQSSRLLQMQTLASRLA